MARRPYRGPSLKSITRALAAGATAIATVPTVYLVVLAAVGVRRPRRGDSVTAPTTRFIVMVPAHDEALGIGATLHSLAALDYPGDRYDVHVVADNCTDRTADVVRAHGWHAHERYAPDDRGKGPALNWLHDLLVCRSEVFDAVVVVDADTTLDRTFLRAMDAALGDGAAAAQGYYAAREADDTPGTAFRSAALACRHHLRPLARTRLGASCGLYGNGMVFRRDILEGRRWSGHLVEDAEFQMHLLLDGYLVRYVPDAALWAEMPRDIEQATSQNERWERGRIEVARSFVPTLVRRAVTCPGRRVALLDAAIDHVVPPLSVLAAAQVVATGLTMPGVLVRQTHARRLLAINLMGVVGLAMHVAAGLRAVGAPPSTYRHLLSAPRIVLWKVRLWASTATSSDVTWTRTRRNVEAHAQSQ